MSVVSDAGFQSPRSSRYHRAVRPSSKYAAPLLSAFLAALLSLSATAQTSQTAADGALLYETRVKPILAEHCLKCHGADPDRLRSELSLATRGGLLRGGAHGPALDPAEPMSSRLLRAVGYHDEQLQMPPSGRLPDEIIAVLKEWVQLGAPYGGEEDALVAADVDEAEFALTEADRAWWSQQPLARPLVPDVERTDWIAGDVDRFILARLEEAGLQPAADASKLALIRRATYDLTGLPPTLDEVRTFLADDEPDAYTRLVDRLLASPQYGVKWGRHWLDLVRFAETDSYERDRLKPGAWRYRDWVIDAFNSDMPYDEFLVHQLAGDEIKRVTASSTIATGYMRLGIWDDEPTDVALAQYDDLDSILDTSARVMLGMSIGCARCHDHMGDPIPQRDYYRMLAFFRGIAPYKEGGGNATTPANYVDRIPQNLGLPGADDALHTWRQRRSELLDEIQDVIAWVEENATVSTTAHPADGLIAHLAFEDDSAEVAVDSVGESVGHINGATTRAEGRMGTAFSFDGHDDYLRLERPVQDDFTISLWFRTDAKAPGENDLRWFRGAGLVDAEVPGIVDDFGVSLVGDGHVTAGAGNPETFLASSSGYNDGAWHHVAFTRRRATGELRLFVDGELVSQAKGSDRPLTSSDVVDIGRIQPGHGYFNGQIDEVRFYERPLTHIEILDLYLGGAASADFMDRLLTMAPGRAASHQQNLTALLKLTRPERKTIEVLRIKEKGPKPPATHVLIRGNPHAPAAPVEPGFPLILDEREPEVPLRTSGASSGRRLALARWITSPDNVRTARVMVNRIWQYHFGRGLVRTPNEFGRFGMKPTHPALLDWLAVEFIERGWSLKSMHRLIMNSRAYRMSSASDPEARFLDPENDLFWRCDMRRLAAEEIRDSILAANGTLNLEMGGAGVYPPMPEEILATASRPDEAWGRSSPEQAARRSVYIHVKRSLLTPLLETFDLADTDATCPVRFVTTQPTQALTMLNSVFMNEQAALLADRAGAGMETTEERVERAIELALAREATADEIGEGVALVVELQEEEGFSAEAAFTNYCLVLLNLNEFVYID